MRHPIVSLAATVTAAVAFSGCAAGTPSAPDTPDVPRPAAVTEATADQLRTTGAPWDRPDNQAELVEAAGLSLDPHEHLDVHYHAQLDVFVDGRQIPVPGGLGISGSDDESGSREHGEAGIAWLHTHDADGVVHVESPQDVEFTLGQVFTEWGVHLSEGQVGGYIDGEGGRKVEVYVDGEAYDGDPADLVLADEQKVLVVAGDAADHAEAKGMPAPAVQ